MDPKDLRYTKEHEWVGASDGGYTVGITDHAQELLGDITYVELPSPGRKAAQGDEVAVVESVKAASDVYAPVSGTIGATNEALDAQPELINTSPYGDGWMFKMTDVDEAQLAALMDAAAYAQFLSEEAH